MKEKTEAQAWRAIALKFENGSARRGICFEINEVPGVSLDTRVDMHDRIRAHLRGEKMQGFRGHWLEIRDITHNGLNDAPRVLMSLFLALEAEDDA